jgi:hypothetical protein
MQQSLFSPFIAEPADFERWSNQRKALFELLKDMRLHHREELIEATGALNITAVVSELRHQGAVIKCTRSKFVPRTIYYQMTAMTPASTVKKGIHCETCRCTS